MWAKLHKITLKEVKDVMREPTGPCLCGDPYCPSCGNPAQAQMEEAIEKLEEEIIAHGLDALEFALFKKTGFETVINLRAAFAIREKEMVEAHREEIDQLKREIEDLTGDLIEAHTLAKDRGY